MLVQDFAYRSPRLPLRLPMELVTSEGILRGCTSDLSEQGLMVIFDSPVLEGTTGRVQLELDTCRLTLEAEVVYAQLNLAGLRFDFASGAERRFVQTLVKLISGRINAELPSVEALR